MCVWTCALCFKVDQLIFSGKKRDWERERGCHSQNTINIKVPTFSHKFRYDSWNRTNHFFLLLIKIASKSNKKKMEIKHSNFMWQQEKHQRCCRRRISVFVKYCVQIKTVNDMQKHQIISTWCKFFAVFHAR